MIETERLVLRRWRSEDVEPYFAIMEHPAVAEWLGATTPEDAALSIERYEHSFATLGYGRFAVDDARSGALVGRVGLMRQDAWTATSAKVEIGWAIDASRWGEGLATEAARAVINDGFDRVGLPTIISFALPENTASIVVMERCGLRLGGHGDHAGRDHVWYSVEAPSRRQGTTSD